MTIEWNYPEPRKGIAGVWDKFIGPGATRAEVVLQLGSVFVAAMAAAFYARRAAPEWTTAQFVVCVLLAADIAGGIVTNATSAAKRWYHRGGQSFVQHFGFAALHVLHLVLVSWLYMEFNVRWFALSSLFLLVSAAAILLVPQYLQRPVSLIAYACALIVSLYILPQPKGLEWFLPFFYLKLLVSHLPKEEPYRPLLERTD